MDLLPVFDEEDEDCNPEDDTDNQLAADISSFVSILGRKFSLLFVHKLNIHFQNFRIHTRRIIIQFFAYH